MMHQKEIFEHLKYRPKYQYRSIMRFIGCYVADDWCKSGSFGESRKVRKLFRYIQEQLNVYNFDDAFYYILNRAAFDLSSGRFTRDKLGARLALRRALRIYKGTC